MNLKMKFKLRNSDNLTKLITLIHTQYVST